MIQALIRIDTRNRGLSPSLCRFVPRATQTPVSATNEPAVLYYAPSIFAALGMSRNTTSLLATSVVGVAMSIATIPAVLYVDKLGWKPVMIVGGVGMFLCHIIITIIFAKNRY
jgi:MFS family permease